jgi:hypothetical protein
VEYSVLSKHVGREAARPGVTQRNTNSACASRQRRMRAQAAAEAAHGLLCRLCGTHSQSIVRLPLGRCRLTLQMKFAKDPPCTGIATIES